MPLFNPPSVSSANGITVDAQGFVTIPNAANAIPFKVVKLAAKQYQVSVLDGGNEKPILITETPT